MDNIKKVLNNKYLMDYIYEFDNTYRENFKKNILVNNILLESAHSFWYDKYEKALMGDASSEYVLELQNGFIDTLLLLMPNFYN